ncbi:MAG: hypothetical protein AB7S78_01045 [Candidatus Omnitrophota bacterium]
MSDFSTLTERLTTCLDQYKYVVSDENILQDVLYIAYVKNPHPLRVRNLCAVLNVPVGVKDNFFAKSFFGKVRNNLLNKYGSAFLWKELEICFVVLCEHTLFQILKDDGGKAVAEAGFSLNSMMGTCFIDKSDHDHFVHSTWGIYFSGDHFKSVRETVVTWCEEQKKG